MQLVESQVKELTSFPILFAGTITLAVIRAYRCTLSPKSRGDLLCLALRNFSDSKCRRSGVHCFVSSERFSLWNARGLMQKTVGQSRSYNKSRSSTMLRFFCEPNKQQETKIFYLTF